MRAFGVHPKFTSRPTPSRLARRQLSTCARCSGAKIAHRPKLDDRPLETDKIRRVVLFEARAMY
jgi:hypothetical protein